MAKRAEEEKKRSFQPNYAEDHLWKGNTSNIEAIEDLIKRPLNVHMRHKIRTKQKSLQITRIYIV